jgi:hypothetical protein
VSGITRTHCFAHGSFAAGRAAASALGSKPERFARGALQTLLEEGLAIGTVWRIYINCMNVPCVTHGERCSVFLQSRVFDIRDAFDVKPSRLERLGHSGSRNSD